MRWGVNYSSCLTLGANEHGLYMATFFLFRLGHSPLFVPWSDVGATERKGWVLRYIDFTFLQAPGVTLRVRQQIGSALLQVGHRDPGTVGEVVA